MPNVLHFAISFKNVDHFYKIAISNAPLLLNGGGLQV